MFLKIKTSLIVVFFFFKSSNRSVILEEKLHISTSFEYKSYATLFSHTNNENHYP